MLFRSEDIANAVRAGAVPGAEVVLEADRSAAFGLVFDRARPGDVVVLAGKGHERTQVFADRVDDFDDRAEALRLLAERVR
mgnify:CR=1 FL=1